jgi:hypothetical protein
MSRNDKRIKNDVYSSNYFWDPQNFISAMRNMPVSYPTQPPTVVSSADEAKLKSYIDEISKQFSSATFTAGDYEQIKNEIISAISSGSTTRDTNDQTTLNAIATAIDAETGSSIDTRNVDKIRQAVVDYIAKAKNDLAAAENERDTAKTALTTAQGQLATVEGERDTAKTALTTAQGQLATVEGERDTAKTALTTAQGQLATVEGERDTAKTALTTAQQKIIDLTAEIGRIDPCKSIEQIIVQIQTIETDIGNINISSILQEATDIYSSLSGSLPSFASITQALANAKTAVQTALTAANNALTNCNSATDLANKQTHVPAAQQAKAAADAAKAAADAAKAAAKQEKADAKAAAAAAKFNQEKEAEKTKYETLRQNITDNYKDDIINVLTKGDNNITDEGKGKVKTAGDNALAEIGQIISKIEATNFDSNEPTKTFSLSGVSTPEQIEKSITDVVNDVSNYAAASSESASSDEYIPFKDVNFSTVDGISKNGDKIEIEITTIMKRNKLFYQIFFVKEFLKIKNMDDLKKLLGIINMKKLSKVLNGAWLNQTFLINNNIAPPDTDTINFYYQGLNAYNDAIQLQKADELNQYFKDGSLASFANIIMNLKKVAKLNELNYNLPASNKYLYKDLKKVYKTMVKYNLDSTYFKGEIKKLNSKYNIKINKSLLSKLLQ